jgi:hypothetical protein
MAPPRLDIPLVDVLHDRVLTVERYAVALRFLGLKSGDGVVIRMDPGAPEAIRVRQACRWVGASIALWNEETSEICALDELLALPTLLIGRWEQQEALEALGARLDVEFVLTIGPEGEGSLDDFAMLADTPFEPASGRPTDPAVG